MVKRFYYFFIFFLFLSPIANAANISTFVNRQNIHVNESFNLVFEADGSVDNDPDFSPLAVYFDILNQSQSSNMSLVNGNFSRKTVWTLVLLAKQAGTYAIPAIEFGDDKSRPLTITVNKSTAQKSTSDQSIFLEVDLDKSSTYVQAQLLYTVKLFRSVDIQNASLTEPELSDADAIVEKMGDDKRYQINRNGVRYIVIERQYAIFPQQSGQLTINPVEFNGQIVSQRRSFFDITPFNNVTKRIVSDKIDIDVKPVPDVFSNKHWLPSPEIRLEDSWPDNAKFKVGEPVTRTITLIATGLTASQLPVIAQASIDHIKQYPDQPKLENFKQKSGLVGSREEKIAYIPTQAGEMTLPEINIPWWNTVTRQLEYARIAAKKIKVIAGAATQPVTNPVTPTLTTDLPPVTNSQASANQPVWFYTTLFLTVLWLLTLGLFLKAKKQHTTLPQPVKQNKKKTRHKDLSKKFASACHQNNQQLCKQVLIDWGRQQWPDKDIHSLGDIVSQLDDEMLKSQINILNQGLYAQAAVDWQASDLLNAFEQYTGKPLIANEGEEPILEPLNKLQ